MSTPTWFTSQPTIQRREWLVVLGIALLAAGLSLWPTITGLRQTPAGQQYLYTNIPDTSDTQVYFAFIEQNALGRPLYANRFTSEPQTAVLANPLWWVLGGLSRLTGYAPEVVFTATRVVGGMGLVALLYILIGHCFSAPRWRWLALMVVVFGGGFGGWLLLLRQDDLRLVWIQTQTPLLRSLPSDLTYAAAYTWASIMHSPLFVAAQALILGTWMIIWRGGRTIWAALLLGLLAFMHPYDPVLVLSVLAGGIVFGILTNTATVAEVKTQLRTMAWLVVGMIPAIGYYLWAMWREPIIREWFHQNILYAPSLTALLAGFGLLSVAAAIGIKYMRRECGAGWTMVVWLISSLVVLYLPLIPFQAKMITLLNVPIGILAIKALQRWWERRSAWRYAVIIVGAAITFSTAVIFPWRISQAQPLEPKYHYASHDLLSALAWLRQHSAGDSIVLGDYFTDNLVPRFADRTAYIGHNLQTINFPTKLNHIRDWFFGVDGDIQAKQKFLAEQRITYIIWGPNERRFGDFSPATLPNTERVFRVGDIDVFQVQN